MAEARIAKVLGLKGAKAPPLIPPSTEEEIEDDTLQKAATIAERLRQEAKHYRERSQELAQQLHMHKHEFQTELHTRSHESEAKITALKQENDLLRRQLSDTGAKMEYYQREYLALRTTINALENFHNTELSKLGDTAALCQQAMMSALAGAARSTRVFLDDLHAKAKHGEPNGHARQDDIQQIVEEEQKLKALAACIAAEPEAAQ
jgi:predicted RNase H-like nuclease (RuvC/YqgF family)